MPICPFCRKPVDAGSIWCSCGANLVRYPNLPVNNKDVKGWLAKYEPQFLASSWSGGSLLERAKRQLLSGQDKEISADTKINAELTEAKGLIKNFLLDCKKEGLVPTIDIGNLRRERWRQWKRIPAEYRQHPPLKNFRLSPGYFFQTSVAEFKDEYCLGIDGTIYKHQLNAPDPFELEELLSVVPVHKLAEALAASLVELLKAKQQPQAGKKQISGTAAIEERSTPEATEPVPAEAATPKRRLRLPFGRRDDKPGSEPAVQERTEVKTQVLQKTATEAAGPAAGAAAPAITGPGAAAPAEPGTPREAAPAATAATPKRRVGKADRRVSTTASAVAPERRSGKTDRRTSATAKAVTPKRRVGKADRRVSTTASAVAPERRSGKADRRAAKAGIGPAFPALEAPANQAPAAEPAAEPENGSRERAEVRLEKTKN